MTLHTTWKCKECRINRFSVVFYPGAHAKVAPVNLVRSRLHAGNSPRAKYRAMPPQTTPRLPGAWIRQHETPGTSIRTSNKRPASRQLVTQQQLLTVLVSQGHMHLMQQHPVTTHRIHDMGPQNLSSIHMPPGGAPPGACTWYRRGFSIKREMQRLNIGDRWGGAGRERTIAAQQHFVGEGINHQQSIIPSMYVGGLPRYWWEHVFESETSACAGMTILFSLCSSSCTRRKQYNFSPLFSPACRPLGWPAVCQLMV